MKVGLKAAAVMAVCGILLYGCEKEVHQQQNQQAQPQAAPQATQPPIMGQQAPQGQQQAPAGGNKVAGITWSVPKQWSEHPGRPMRHTTYMVPGSGSEGGEVAVFYFGQTEGGDVESNVNRWVNQFEKGEKHSSSQKVVNGFNVTLVTISGTYLAPSGPMMQSSGKKSGYRLLGAIVGAPEGYVFFKFTGPTKVIAGAEKDFMSLVNSFKRG